MSADNLSASILSANTLSAVTLTANTLLANNITADNITADWNNVIHPTGYSLFDLSDDLSNKIFVKNELSADGETADLSVIKISKDDYDKQITSKTLLSDNILYVVEADYIDAYGQVISNLVMTDNTNPSEATNKDYVDKNDEKLSKAISDETIRAEEAEQTIAKAISDETARAEAAEKVNADAITENTKNIETNAENIETLNSQCTRYIDIVDATQLKLDDLITCRLALSNIIDIDIKNDDIDLTSTSTTSLRNNISALYTMISAFYIELQKIKCCNKDLIDDLPEDEPIETEITS